MIVYTLYLFIARGRLDARKYRLLTCFVELTHRCDQTGRVERPNPILVDRVIGTLGFELWSSHTNSIKFDTYVASYKYQCKNPSREFGIIRTVSSMSG